MIYARVTRHNRHTEEAQCCQKRMINKFFGMLVSLKETTGQKTIKDPSYVMYVEYTLILYDSFTYVDVLLKEQSSRQKELLSW